MQNHNDNTIKTSEDTVLWKIYLSLYLKGLCVRGSWRPNRTKTYWPPHSYGHQRFFPVLQGCSTGGPGAQLSAGCWLSLPHLVSKLSDLQKLTDFLSSPSYIIVQSPTQYLPITDHRNVSLPLNGMFDRHRAEITVMQFTDHSLPVHQSVTLPWDFNPVPYCQPSSPMPMEYALLPSLEWHVWQGWRSICNIWTIH